MNVGWLGWWWMVFGGAELGAGLAIDDLLTVDISNRVSRYHENV